MAGKSGAPGALFCDTNVLVRLFTNDPPRQALAVERAFDNAREAEVAIVVTDVVMAELAYVLTGPYGLSPAEAGERILAILDLPGIEVADESVLRDTVAIWTSRSLDFTDAYLAALARSTKETGILSFDRDFDRTEGVLRVDPVRF